MSETQRCISFGELTYRKLYIVDMLAEGHTTAEIARDMGLSQQTVANVITHTMRRLQLHDREELVREYLEWVAA